MRFAIGLGFGVFLGVSAIIIGLHKIYGVPITLQSLGF